MSKSRPQAGSAEPEAAAGEKAGSKRKAVAPGYLRGLLQARQRMKSMGLKAAAAGAPSCSSSSAAPRTGSGGGGGGRGQGQLYVPPATLPLLFAQRKKFLQASKVKGTPQPYRLNEELPVGLLSLPEDVLVSGGGAQGARGRAAGKGWRGAGMIVRLYWACGIAGLAGPAAYSSAEVSTHSRPPLLRRSSRLCATCATTRSSRSSWSASSSPPRWVGPAGWAGEAVAWHQTLQRQLLAVRAPAWGDCGAPEGRGWAVRTPPGAPRLPADSRSCAPTRPPAPQLKTAVHFHFNYATPFRHVGESGPPLPRPDRNKKKAVTNLAAVLSHLTRSGRLTAEA